MKKIAFSLATAACLLLLSPNGAVAGLHPGDKISIQVYNHPELSAQPTIDADGTVALPLAGVVRASGLSVRDFAARIEVALAAYVRKPAVDVTVVQRVQSLFVTGGPGGVIAYQPPESLTTALGQLQIGAAVDLTRVAVERDGRTLGTFDSTALVAHGLPGPALEPGDTLVLRNKPIAVTVRGDVVKPGIAYLESGQTLAEALAQVGGTITTTAATQAVLQRAGSTRTVTLGAAAANLPAVNGDVLVVPSAVHVSVVGMVQTPGEVTLHQNFTLLAAMYYAGGPTQYADVRSVQVLRNGSRSTYDITRLVHGDATQNPAIDDGDVVFVPEGHKIDFRVLFQALTAAGWLLK